MRNFCAVHILDTLLSLLYGVLCMTCWRVIVKHRSAITSGNATGLSCYLICSCFFCIYRTISLWILILIDSNCSHSYGSDGYLDVLDLINNRVVKLRYAQFMLASLARTFFYSSYAYFAYSLTKVLDLLTTSRREIRSTKANSHFLNVYIVSLIWIGIMFAMWISETLIWMVSLTQEESVRFVYICARVANATSSLVISAYIAYYLIQAFLYIRHHGKDSGRGHQLYGLLKMRRIQGVCFVSIIVFTLRWLILIFQIDFHPILADIFLFFAEICPTAFMLYVFRSSGDGDTATPNGSSEVNIVKESITSSFISAMNAKSLFSTSLDEDDEFLEEYSRPSPFHSKVQDSHPMHEHEEFRTGLEAYWERSAMPPGYEFIPEDYDLNADRFEP